ncbi:MAG: type II toxin-antitoxin system TacA family antitoxin [Candidatus Dormibacteria bacterium]
MTTTARIEMRAPAEQVRMIREAAVLRGASLTGFILEAATKAAEDALALPAETLVPPHFFDDLLAALTMPDEIPTGLGSLARRPRPYERR